MTQDRTNDAPATFRRRIIINADDLGASHGINRGIAESHMRGAVTSASLMVNMPATDAAILMVRELRTLSVGLHVNFTNEGGEPIVDLDDTNGCRQELLAQYESFRSLAGREPTHLDSQHHIHTRSNLTPVFEDLARTVGLPLRGSPPVNYVGSFYGQWDGQTHIEQLTVESLTNIIISESKGEITEFGCHPGYIDDAFETVYNHEREVELTTLCDPSLRGAIGAARLDLIGFGELLFHPTSPEVRG